MLRPSDAHLWVPCPLAGNLLATGEYPATQPVDPRPVSDSRREGICAHWVAEQCITTDDLHPADMVGMAHSNGWVVDDEMAAHVYNYLWYIASQAGEAAAAERSVELFELIRGYLDAIGHTAGPTVKIFDLKYGWRLVEAEQNYSMLCYGLAVVAPGQALEMHIYQPRPNHPDGPARVWRIEADDIEQWRGWLQARAEDCAVYPHGKPGRHCNNCPAAHSCHALASDIYARFQTIQDDRQVNHTPEQLAAELHFLDLAQRLVDARREAVRSEAMARINRGHRLPGWAMAPKLGHRRFTVSRYAVRLATGIEPTKTTEMTPAELERQGVPKHIMEQIASRPVVGRDLTSNVTAMAKRMFK